MTVETTPRSAPYIPARAPAFLAGTLLATTAIALVFVIALAVGFRVVMPARTVDPASLVNVPRAPIAGQPYDGPLDPAERDYIRQVNGARRTVAAPQPSAPITVVPRPDNVPFEVPRTHPAAR